MNPSFKINEQMTLPVHIFCSHRVLASYNYKGCNIYRPILKAKQAQLVLTVPY